MSFRKRMNKRRKNLKRRHDDQTKKSKQQGRYPTIFLKDKVPDGVEFFTCKEGEHIADIIPFAAGPNMPLDDRGLPVTEEGELDYIIDLWVHSNIGSMKKPYVCPYENFGEECPICTYIKANRLEKNDWNALRAKRRSIYLIWVHDTREQERKGIQIFESAYFFMEEKIDEIAKLPRGGGSINFSDYEDGKTLCWTRKGSGRDNTQYLGHKLIDREGPIPDRILDQSFSLDTVINMKPSIEEIERGLMGTLKERKLLEDDSENEGYPDTGDDVPFDDEDYPDEQEERQTRRKRPTSRKKQTRKRETSKSGSERTGRRESSEGKKQVRRKRRRTK